MNRFYTFSSVAMAILLNFSPSLLETQALEPPSSNAPYLIAQNREKVRVAVLDFDYSNVSDPRWIGILGGREGARGVSDILINKLVESGRYSVIERSRLDAVLREQNLGASGRVDASTAAQIGRILGVDYVIVGSITEFDIQQSRQGINVPFVGQTRTNTEASVKLNARMVNTTTAEIVGTSEGKGTANQSDGSLRVIGFGGGSSTSNEGRLLATATNIAITEVAEGINSQANTLAAAPSSIPAVNALVAAITGNQVILNKGAADGYRVGMKMSIERVTQQVKDPVTGEVIRELTQPVGMIEIVEVDPKSSVGRVISGTTFNIGDLAKPTR